MSEANAERRYDVTRADLPLSCPMPGMTLWSSHPKVYLPIEEDGGEAKCPYCGAEFRLTDPPADPAPAAGGRGGGAAAGGDGGAPAP